MFKKGISASIAMAVAMVAVSLSLATHIAHADATVKTAPTKLVYIVGEKFDPTGLVFTTTGSANVTYSTENADKFKFLLSSSANAGNDHTDGQFAASLEALTAEQDDCYIRVFYKIDSSTWEAANSSNQLVVDNPAEASESAKVSKAPTKAEYKLGDKLDLTGLQISFDGTNNWSWSNTAEAQVGYKLKIGEEEVKNGDTVKSTWNNKVIDVYVGENSTVEGTGGESAAKITITAPTSIDVKTAPTTQYYSSSANKIKLDGLVVSAIYGSDKRDVKWGEDKGLTAAIDGSAVTSGTTTITSDSVVTLSLMEKTTSIPLYYVTRNKTIYATAAGVSISGDLSSKATELTATKIEPNSTTYTEMHKLITTGYTPVAAYDVSLPANAVFEGYARLTFNVGSEYNGRKAQILHYVGGADFSDSEEATVVNGTVTAKFRSLSPFMVAIAPASADNNTNTNTNTNDKGNTNSGSSKSSNGNKKTGDSALALGISSIGLLTLSAAGMLLFKKKREALHLQ